MPRLAALTPLVLALACGADTGATTDTTTAPASSTSTGEPASSTSSTTDAPTTSSSTSTGEPTSTTTGEPTSTTTTPDATTADTTTGGVDGVIVVDGLSHPESILHDPIDDIYLISNINGAPDAPDDNGFIARVKPDGTVESLSWISGGAVDIELNAPKGLAIVGDTLYVADLTHVRKFDRVTGAPLGEVLVDGAVFLNDLSADPSGNVYVSDSSANTIHVIDPADKVTLLLADPNLSGPNGLVADETGVTVATYGANLLLRVDAGMPAVDLLTTLPQGGLDGLVQLDGGAWLVTSWDASAVLRVEPDLQSGSVALKNLPSPADLDVDRTRGRALVPLLLEDRAEFHLLP